MKLLTVKDEIIRAQVNDSHFDDNALHFLDEKTDEQMKLYAAKYFEGHTGAHLKRMKADNAYLIYENTDIKYGEQKQSQGVILQFNVADGEICDVNFFTADTAKVKGLKTLLSGDITKSHYTPENAEAIKNDNLFYDKDLARIFGEMGKDFEIDKKDNYVFYKNQYLILEKGRMEGNILYDLCNAIKKQFDENAKQDRAGRCVRFTLDGKERRVNISGGKWPEMNGYRYPSTDVFLKYMERIKNEHVAAPNAFYNGAEFKISKYSNTKNMEDLVETQFKDKYLQSLISYNENMLNTKSRENEVEEGR